MLKAPAAPCEFPVKRSRMGNCGPVGTSEVWRDHKGIFGLLSWDNLRSV